VIPTYAADGRRLRNYSPDEINHLLSLSLVVVRRNQRGQIRVAQFRGQGGANPLRRTAHLGTRYAFLGEARVWKHRRLLQSQDVEYLFGEPDNLAEAELFVQAVFRAVPLSCLKREKPAKAKVIPIDARTKREKKRQKRRKRALCAA
jgi:hypothetical protein